MSKNTEYQKSPIGLIPQEWRVDIIGRLSFITKLAGFEYTNYFDYEKQGDVIALRVLNIRNGKLDLKNIQTIPKSISSQLPRSSLAKNDLVISYVGTIGLVALINEDDKFHLAPNVAKISPNTQKLNPAFLLYQLLSEKCQKRLFDLSTVTSQPALSMSKLRQLLLVLPSLPEQEKISEILDTIDRTITHTEALIEKYQQIKAGLMHDLFTRGIGADGKLRPPRDKAPELYQDSSIGWIPKEWKLEALNYGLSASPKNGYSPKEVDNWQDVYVLGLGCLTRNGFSPTQLKNAPKNSLFSGAKLEDGDFLISRSNTQELVGLCGIYHDIGHDVIYPDLMIKLKFNKNLVGEFLEKYLLSKAARQRISAIAVGTSGSMVKINATTLKALKVIYPKSDEQLEIVEKLEPIENQISCLKIQFDKLKKQKSGLMHDLLTGTVQVNSDPV